LPQNKTPMWNKSLVSAVSALLAPSDEHMFWLFSKTGIVTVAGALLLLLAIYLIRVNPGSPDIHRPEPAANSNQQWPTSP
jgi:hypothetical protein